MAVQRSIHNKKESFPNYMMIKMIKLILIKILNNKILINQMIISNNKIMKTLIFKINNNIKSLFNKDYHYLK